MFCRTAPTSQGLLNSVFHLNVFYFRCSAPGSFSYEQTLHQANWNTSQSYVFFYIWLSYFMAHVLWPVIGKHIQGVTLCCKETLTEKQGVFSNIVPDVPQLWGVESGTIFCLLTYKIPEHSTGTELLLDWHLMTSQGCVITTIGKVQVRSNLEQQKSVVPTQLPVIVSFFTFM